MTNKLIQHHKNHHHILPPPPRSTSTIQACAACRYQRRKCAPDCILAPYFPHDRQRQFQNAHKLFGVSNITKIIRHLDRPQKDEAMRTIIYQSDVRSIDPVGGCYRIIQQLQRQIEISCAELDFVLQQLTICRTLCIQNNNNNNTNNHNNNNNNNNNINIDINNNNDDDQINDQQFSHDLIVIDEIDYNIHLVNNPDEPHLYDDDNNLNIKYNHDHVEDNNNINNDNNNVHVVPRVHENSRPLHAAVCDDFKSILINDINSESERKETNESSEKILFDEESYQKDMIKVENVCYNEEQYEIVMDHKSIHEIV